MFPLTMESRSDLYISSCDPPSRTGVQNSATARPLYNVAFFSTYADEPEHYSLPNVYGQSAIFPNIPAQQTQSYTLSDALRLPFDNDRDRQVNKHVSHSPASPSGSNSISSGDEGTNLTSGSTSNGKSTSDAEIMSSSEDDEDELFDEGPDHPEIKDEPVENQFVLESQVQELPHVGRSVDAMPQIRFRRPKTPQSQAMRELMSVFHVDPFSTGRTSSDNSPSFPLEVQEDTEPTYLTFQLRDGTMEPVEDPETQFFVAFIEENDYLRSCDERRDSQLVASRGSGDLFTTKPLRPLSNPFRDYTHLTLYNDHCNSLSDGDVSPSSQYTQFTLVPDSETGMVPKNEPDRPKKQNRAWVKKPPKMHACSQCDKAFPRPSALSTHMNSHSGEKPFKCPVPSCDKYFTVRSNAKRHLRTHRNASPFDDMPAPPLHHFDSPGAADMAYEFDEPMVTHVRENGPQKLRWTPSSVSLHSRSGDGSVHDRERGKGTTETIMSSPGARVSASRLAMVSDR